MSWRDQEPGRNIVERDPILRLNGRDGSWSYLPAMPGVAPQPLETSPRVALVQRRDIRKLYVGQYKPGAENPMCCVSKDGYEAFGLGRRPEPSEADGSWRDKVGPQQCRDRVTNAPICPLSEFVQGRRAECPPIAYVLALWNRSATDKYDFEPVFIEMAGRKATRMRQIWTRQKAREDSSSAMTYHRILTLKAVEDGGYYIPEEAGYYDMTKEVAQQWDAWVEGQGGKMWERSLASFEALGARLARAGASSEEHDAQQDAGKPSYDDIPF